MEGEVLQRVDALFQHAALQDQDDDGHDDANGEERQQHHGDHRLADFPQADQGGASALAADGGVGLAGADELLVDEHGDGGDDDHQDRHGKRRLGVLGLAVHVQLAGQGVVLHRGAQVVDGAEGADGLGEGQDHRGEDGRQHQRQRDPAEDHGLAGALDLTHLLQLGVDGVQCRRHQQICIGVIVERQHDDDGDGAVGQPLRHVQPQGCHEARCAAEAGGLEHGQPSLRFAPGGDHVGDDHCQGEKLLEGQIRADHQPCQDGSQQDGTHGDTYADGQGVDQRLDQHGPGQFAGQEPLPVIQRKRSHVIHGTAHGPQIPLGQLEGSCDHVQQRQNDQIDQQDDGDQYDDVVGIGHHGLDLILQPPAF